MICICEKILRKLILSKNNLYYSLLYFFLDNWEELDRREK